MIQTVPDTSYDKVLTQEPKGNWVNKALSLNVDPNHVIFVPHMFESLVIDLNGSQRQTKQCAICYSLEWVHKHFQGSKDIPRLDVATVRAKRQLEKVYSTLENNQDLDEETKQDIKAQILESLRK